MQKTILSSCLLIIGAWAAAAADTHVSETGLVDNNGQPITVIGQLGKPLGTALQEITCNRTDFRGLANPVAISEADGKTLNLPVILDIRWAGTNAETVLTPGITYKLQGYETGEFGVPPPPVPKPPAGQTNSPPPATPKPKYRFQSVFVVTKILEPAGN